MGKRFRETALLEMQLFGPDAVFEHIGLAVHRIQDAVGTQVRIVADETQRVSVAFVEMSGIRIELIEPLGEHTPITGSLKKGVKLLHLCFRVPDIEVAIRDARRNGFRCLANPVPAKALGGRMIVWMYSTAYGLVELLEA